MYIYLTYQVLEYIIDYTGGEMIKKNKNVSDGLSGNTQSNLPVVVKRDSLVTIVTDYLNKLFMRDTKDKYRAEVYKVINVKNN